MPDKPLEPEVPDEPDVPEFPEEPDEPELNRLVPIPAANAVIS